MEPLISIIIPTYNRAGLILETLNSVLTQTYQNWECIVVDDFSTDNTKETIDAICGSDGRFSFYTNQRQKGAPGCRNTGVNLSNGDFLLFLDSDDLLKEDCLEKRIRFFQKYSENDFLVFSTIEFKETIHDTNVLINVLTGEDMIIRFLNMDVPWLTSGPIWRTESFVKLGEWNEALLSWQDWELHLRALLQNFRFIFFSVIDNYHRCTNVIPTINSVSTSEGHLLSHLKMVTALKQEIRKNAAYLDRLNGLIYWIAEKSLEQGFIGLSKTALIYSHEELHGAKKLINLLSLVALKRLFIRHPRMPDFGTYRKVLHQF